MYRVLSFRSIETASTPHRSFPNREAVGEFTKRAKQLRAAAEAATEHALLPNLAKSSKLSAETAHRPLRSHIVDTDAVNGSMNVL